MNIFYFYFPVTQHLVGLSAEVKSFKVIFFFFQCHRWKKGGDVIMGGDVCTNSILLITHFSFQRLKKAATA